MQVVLPAPRRPGRLPCWLLLALVMAPGSAASADNAGGTVAVASALIDRGISIAPDRVTLQAAGYWLPSPGCSVSAAVAVQAPSLSQPVALTAQAARAWMLDDRWQMQASVLYYVYPEDGRSRTFNRQEASLAWSYRDVLTFSLSTFRFPRAQQAPWNTAIDITGNLPLSAAFSLTGGAGVSEFPAMAYGAARGGRYQYGQLGLKWSRARWTVELQRVFTSSSTPRAQGGPGQLPWLGMLSRTF
ncbi:MULTISPECIES: hypothetical protein [Xanthomonas]|uniref:DUF2490 domain-containing protein n=1 Tax=Xanthomonas cucurbitae TaxID=56453 RepID=A0ABY7YGH9_9XANT|nr:hypothetical protein EBN15_07185 [Xanthomonas cucurbitae]WDM69134.1 hypothetical protein K6981_07805 [Xanthomonas cucurbitae]WDM73005.1 hypothetical protein K6978_07775 [Xanthomonas cucurbitae]WDM76728.1 hypothetical protein K6982_07110 [Xanthomonas cucurbitae]